MLPWRGVFSRCSTGEPSVEDTIGILRGLKERYEIHHGIRIQDAAIVAAATLSNRYITDRFLPDKAIDLVDEAGVAHEDGNRLDAPGDRPGRTARDAAPDRATSAEEGERRSQSQKRLVELEVELSELNEKKSGMRAQWLKEKDVIGKIRSQTRRRFRRS